MASKIKDLVIVLYAIFFVYLLIRYLVSTPFYDMMLRITSAIGLLTSGNLLLILVVIIGITLFILGIRAMIYVFKGIMAKSLFK